MLEFQAFSWYTEDTLDIFDEYQPEDEEENDKANKSFTVRIFGNL